MIDRPQPLHVVPDLSSAAILGQDWVKSQGAIIDMCKNTVVIKDMEIKGTKIKSTIVKELIAKSNKISIGKTSKEFFDYLSKIVAESREIGTIYNFTYLLPIVGQVTTQHR